MKKGRFTETQIVKALHEEQSGRKADDICRELGVSRATFYNWKNKYSGMEVNQLKQLRELQEENRKLKAMYADLVDKTLILTPLTERLECLVLEKPYTFCYKSWFHFTG